MTTENARFKEEAGGLISEALAPRIHIAWDPITDYARVSFETVRYLKVGDQYVTRMDAELEFLEIEKEELASSSYEINGKTITGADVDMFVRLLYDDKYNERDAAMHEPDDPSQEE